LPPPHAPVASARQAPRGREVTLLFATALLALVASPIALAFLLVGPRELGRRKTPASWKWSGLLVAALAALLVAAAVVDLPAVFQRWAGRAPPIAGILPPVGAGLLWGALVLSIGVWLAAPIRGLERIRHEALWPLLRSWAALGVLRAAALAVLYGPLMVTAARTCAAFALPARVTWAFAVPAAGLLMHFWWLSLVDNLAVYVDVAFVLGPPTAKNPWHATMKRYFTGYIRRNVIAIDPRLLERTLFLPSVRKDVIAYGGGFAAPRIVVGEKPLEAALGELPDEEEQPDRTVNAEELPAGLLAPTRAPEGDQAQLARAEAVRHAFAIAPPRRRAHVPRLLGESATRLGWLLPQAAQTEQQADKGIPLISDTEEDFGVVKRLLSEHYAAFEGDLDDEVDDTDPTQKDFLFGALLREIGVIARHDVYFSTIRHSLEVARLRGSWLSYVTRVPLALFERFLSVPAARVADAYAALNTGLHYLVQYLCFVRGTNEKLLTARANLPRLLGASRAMLIHLERGEPSAEERDAFRATPYDRVLWLTSVFHGRRAPRQLRWGRVVVATVVLAASATLAVRSVVDSVRYHPIYVERIARLKAQAAKSAEGDNVR
jgi:hypothetical protein